jgi:outer membrane lipoprotein-sorting protein
MTAVFVRYFLTLCALTLAIPSSAQGTRERTPLPSKKGQEILDAYYKTIHGAKTIYILEEAKQGTDWLKSESWLMRPNFYRSKMQGSGNGAIQVLTSHRIGDSIYSVDQSAKTYDVMDMNEGPYINGLEPFTSKSRPPFTAASVVYEGSFGQSPAYVIPTGPQSVPGSLLYVYIARRTYLPLGYEYWWRNTGEFHAYTLFKIDQPMSAVDFSWKPPANYKLRNDLRHETLYGKPNEELLKRLNNPPVHPKATPKSREQAKAIVLRMTNVYRAMKSYSDEGTNTTVMTFPGNVSTEEMPFKTAFKRPGKFRFEFSSSRRGQKSTYLLIAAGKRMKLPVGGDPKKLRSAYVADTTTPLDKESNVELGLSIAGFTGISHGVAHQISRMLMSEVEGFIVSDLQDLQLEGEELVDGRRCYRIYTREHDTTYWIDKSTSLLRKTEEFMDIEDEDGRPSSKSIARTVYRPVINPKLDDARFKK